MKRIFTLLISLTLAFAAAGQNPLDRPMEPVPEMTVTLPSLKDAKALMASDETHLKCRGAWAMLNRRPSKAAKLVVKALQGDDREYADAVLGYVDETVGAATVASAVEKAFPKLKESARADVLYWIGRNRLSSLQSLVNSSFIPGETGTAAIFAAKQMGGAHNLALLDALVREGSPLAGEVLRLRGQAGQDDDDATRNSLRDSK